MNKRNITRVSLGTKERLQWTHHNNAPCARASQLRASSSRRGREVTECNERGAEGEGKTSGVSRLPLRPRCPSRPWFQPTRLSDARRELSLCGARAAHARCPHAATWRTRSTPLSVKAAPRVIINSAERRHDWFVCARVWGSLGGSRDLTYILAAGRMEVNIWWPRGLINIMHLL